jgi:lauroyl/myristoyl acyltransferase
LQSLVLAAAARFDAVGLRVGHRVPCWLAVGVVRRAVGRVPESLVLAAGVVVGAVAGRVLGAFVRRVLREHD